jgi:hypothetical protein
MIAEDCDVAPSTVYRVLKRNGLAISDQSTRLRRRSTTADDDAEIVQRYLAGESAVNLAAGYGFRTHVSITQRVRAAGHEIRPVGPALQDISEELGAEILRLRNEEGLSQEETGRRLGVAQPRISRWLKVNGHRTWELSRHPNFKGRVFTSGGYVLIHLPDDDEFSSMRTVSGYVLEHRLVMAQALGRLLLSTETVHHINGNPADNRLENLQLRQGNHGKGIVMRCKECGSHSVEPVQLS